MKTPNPKSQTLNKHQTPSSKSADVPLADGWHYVSPASEPSPPWILKDQLTEPPSSTTDQRHPFDLEERTAVFGERIVRFSKKVPRSPTNNRLIDQLVGAGTSGGANYCEANDCVSKKDFRNIIKRCIKETKETPFFLRMIAASEPPLAEEARGLYREATELIKIFASMYRK
jgi:four helix bundle protein